VFFLIEGIKCLCGNRDDFGAFHFQNLLVVEPFVASQLCRVLILGQARNDKKNTAVAVSFSIMARPEGFAWHKMPARQP